MATRKEDAPIRDSWQDTLDEDRAAIIATLEQLIAKRDQPVISVFFNHRGSSYYSWRTPEERARHRAMLESIAEEYRAAGWTVALQDEHSAAVFQLS